MSLLVITTLMKLSIIGGHFTTFLLYFNYNRRSLTSNQIAAAGNWLVASNFGLLVLMVAFCVH